MITFPQDGYSRTILYVKLGLGTVGIALIGVMLFYIARSSDIVLVREDLGELAETLDKEQVNEAQLQAVTKEGAGIRLNFGYLKNIRFLRGGKLAGNVIANLVLKDGRRFYIFANTGVFSRATQTVYMSGGVSITSSNGHLFETDVLKFSTKDKRVETETPVYLRFDNLTLKADTMLVRDKKNVPDESIARFMGNVRLTYRPRRDNGGDFTR